MSKVEMEKEEVTRMPALPEELVERILALVPFPYIFKARALSKSWLARLSPVSFPHDDEEKRMAILFQRRMAQDWSTKWPTFCPISISGEDLVAYDRASRRWQPLPSVREFIPENPKMSSWQMQGALLLTSIISAVSKEAGWRSEDVYVANVLTRSWKLLPPCPGGNEVLEEFKPLFCLTRTLVTHTEEYKVIEICKVQHRQDLCLALIYESKNDAWKRKMVEIPAGFRFFRKGAHYNGAIYWLVGPHVKPRGLLAFNVEEETFEVLQLPALDLAHPIWVSFDLVVCDGSLILLVVCLDGPSTVWEHRAIVIRIDLESRRWLEVTRGPPFHCNRFVTTSDSECAYIVGKGLGEDFERGYEYNMKNDEWSTFPLLDNFPFFGRCSLFEPSSFQPGLNPLLAL